ncbi:MAG: hypothetical protein VX017_01415 [Pseudomonadota bacterium]|nr:hypothetical protein [Pseudomonadota bacterium]
MRDHSDLAAFQQLTGKRGQRPAGGGFVPLLRIAGMRLKHADMRTPDKVLLRRGRRQLLRKPLEIESRADVIDQIHHGIIERRPGKGAWLALAVASEREGVLAGDRCAQPAPDAQPVIDDFFEALIWCHGSCLHCRGPRCDIVAVVEAGVTASM